MEDVLDLTIDSIAAGGDGVARHQGMVVFVPRSAPGDRLTARVRMAGRLARGRTERLQLASADRVEPRCHHYDGDDCGGCQLQHLSYAAQLNAKRRIVNDALERIGRTTARLEDVTPSPSPWSYRTKLTLTVRQQGDANRIGLRHREHPDQVFELRECPITDPRVVAAWQEVGAARHFLPSERTLSGAIRLDDDALTFVLNGGRSWPAAQSFVLACPSLGVVRWHPHGGGVRTMIDRHTGGLPAASFQQVNPAVAALLHDALVQRAMSHEPRSAVDAYSGIGATAVALDAQGVRVTAIELDAEASGYCGRRLNPPSRAIAARVEDALPSTLPAELVLLNPPRSGVDASVTHVLQQAVATTRAILYVSCNAATLARDIQRLPAYRVSWLNAFDMFPQTAHVETVCELVPEHA